MNSFFSVIISVYNKEQYIRDTLQSVLNQTCKDFEIIIVNDGSTDNSLSVLNQFDDARITIINQDNQGASQARNNGISRATGKFIALIDGDDLWDKTFLENIKTLIANHPEYSVFTTAIAHKYGDKISPVPYSFKATANVSILDYFKASERHTILSGSSTVFKKDILDVTGNFDTDIKSGQDTDLWIRIGLHYPIVFLNTVLVYYVQNQNSLSNTTTDLSNKSRFDNYKFEEKENVHLKKFLDNNRFSLALLAKLNKNKKAYKYYKSEMSKKNLSLKRRFLLIAPTWLTKQFLKLRKVKNTKTYYPILDDTKSS
ncbi:glycosyltransferase family 2 protein [Psychroserpens algicola]|uniref:Glycosyltransferase family 2 protein n=1 Tax=Psychroserpens algicola TaxID=1719034 RepID=A0ABT0H6W5_9FLAO|nr:glycosyltransferase family 2 protein [Psychroserpens algicola]MCK8480121.1 glycosyltransferase family 2 protein [Psychroserpens algicola]